MKWQLTPMRSSAQCEPSSCRLDGRFLLVRGDLHEYRIHLGSANVLMEPGSRYLCIVQGPGDSAANLPLPFEGDRILGLVLSKALLETHS
jgi:hypothetical protein